MMPPIYIESIADLRSNTQNLPTSLSDKCIFIVGGYHQRGDGGGGTFKARIDPFPPLSNWHDDGGLLILSHAYQTNGVWYQRIVDTPYINVKWFGAKGNWDREGPNFFDDAPYINNAFNACANYLDQQNQVQRPDSGYTVMALNLGVDDVSRTRIYFPAGIYAIDSPIALKHKYLNYYVGHGGASLEIIGENSVVMPGPHYKGGFALQVSAYLNVKISGMAFVDFKEALLLNKSTFVTQVDAPFEERSSRVLIENCQFVTNSEPGTSLIHSTGISINLKHSMIEVRDVTWRGVFHCIDLYEGNVTCSGGWVTAPAFNIVDQDANFIVHNGYLNLENMMAICESTETFKYEGWIELSGPTKLGSKKQLPPLGSASEHINSREIDDDTHMSTRPLNPDQGVAKIDPGSFTPGSPVDPVSSTIQVYVYGSGWVKNINGCVRMENVRFAERPREFMVLNYAKGHKDNPSEEGWPSTQPKFIIMKNTVFNCRIPVKMFEIPNSIVFEDNQGFITSISPLVGLVEIGNWKQKLAEMYGYFSIKIDNVAYYASTSSNTQSHRVARYLLPYVRINNGFDSYGCAESNLNRFGQPQELLFFLGKKSSNSYGPFSSIYGNYSYEVELLNVCSFAHGEHRNDINISSIYRIETHINYNAGPAMEVVLTPIVFNGGDTRSPKLTLDPTTNKIEVSANSNVAYRIYYQIRNLIPPVTAPHEI